MCQSADLLVCGSLFRGRRDTDNVHQALAKLSNFCCRKSVEGAFECLIDVVAQLQLIAVVRQLDSDVLLWGAEPPEAEARSLGP